MHEDIGLNFAAALRSFLRQDPDIIMVGEIRDFETAEIAVKAALTGHLVLSTLHTNDAPSTVTRLLNMGIEPFLVAASVNCILAQRLARRICAECKERDAEVTPQALLDAGLHRRGDPRPRRSSRAAAAGPAPRPATRAASPLYEVMALTDELKEFVLKGASAAELKTRGDPRRHDRRCVAARSTRCSRARRRSPRVLRVSSADH